jgi:hypothetical protein
MLKEVAYFMTGLLAQGMLARNAKHMSAAEPHSDQGPHNTKLVCSTPNDPHSDHGPHNTKLACSTPDDLRSVENKLKKSAMGMLHIRLEHTTFFKQRTYSTGVSRKPLE